MTKTNSDVALLINLLSEEITKDFVTEEGDFSLTLIPEVWMALDWVSKSRNMSLIRFLQGLNSKMKEDIPLQGACCIVALCYYSDFIHCDAEINKIGQYYKTLRSATYLV